MRHDAPYDCNMKTFEEYNSEGQLIYFEVSNTFLPRKSAVRIIKEISNVEILEEDKRADVFCIFKLGNKVFEIMEPFGDNSRYHVGEPKVQNSKELEIIKEKFSAYKISILSILGR